MRPILLFKMTAALGVLVAVVVPAFAVEPSKASIPQLIDQLTQVDAQSLGLDGFGLYSGFIADDSPLSFEMGLLGAPPPKVSPLMRELVRRVPESLPLLVAHLSDQRPTKLEVGNTAEMLAQNKRNLTFLFRWMEFSDEYDPRMRGHAGELRQHSVDKRFEGTYTVKVGDVCYALIGQIVNRRLFAVRYQPTGGLIVNSPVETPALAERTKADWNSVGAEALKASLLADMHWADEVKAPNMDYLAKNIAYGALQRLRLYFPETYKTLTGNDLKRKIGFELEEAREKAGDRAH